MKKLIFFNEFSNLNHKKVKTNDQNLPKFSELDLIYIYIKEAVKNSRFRNNPNRSCQQIIKVLNIEFMEKSNKKYFFSFLWTFILVYYVVFLTVTVDIVLILSTSSGTKETVVVAGSGTQSAVVGNNDVGDRNTESLNTACSSSKLLIRCDKLISFELSSFKASLESISRSLSSL